MRINNDNYWKQKTFFIAAPIQVVVYKGANNINANHKPPHWFFQGHKGPVSGRPAGREALVSLPSRGWLHTMCYAHPKIGCAERGVHKMMFF